MKFYILSLVSALQLSDHAWYRSIGLPGPIWKMSCNNLLVLPHVTCVHYFPLIFLWFIYQNVSNSWELWNNTCRCVILHTLNLGCSFITIREPCSNQQLKCVITGFMLQIIYNTGVRVKQLTNLMLHVRLFNCLTLET